MEIETAHIQIRVIGEDGLTRGERFAIDAIVQELGYESVEQLARDNGFISPREMAYNHNFKNVRDYFLGEGWYDRLKEYDKNVKH